MMAQPLIKTTAQKAVYDAGQQRRRSMIGKVKLAQKALGLVDDDYRAMLLRETGCTSAADCTEGQLARMIEAMKRAGFKPVAKVGTGPSARVAAQGKAARKARALWISLHQLGVVHNPSEIALEAFAKRQLKVDALAWANDGQMFKLIEALKAMAEKNGWSQALDGVHPTQTVRVLRHRLCEAIHARLIATGVVPADMRLKQVAFTLCGLEDERGTGPGFWEPEALDLLAKGLAAKLHAVCPPNAANGGVA